MLRFANPPAALAGIAEPRMIDLVSSAGPVPTTAVLDLQYTKVLRLVSTTLQKLRKSLTVRPESCRISTGWQLVLRAGDTAAVKSYDQTSQVKGVAPESCMEPGSLQEAKHHWHVTEACCTPLWRLALCTAEMAAMDTHGSMPRCVHMAA